MPQDVAIVIPHHNDAARLIRCLEALCPQLSPGAEVVVVDNASSEPVTGIGAFPGVRLVVEDRKGAAHARNRGVAETRAPLVIFLDCDCIPAPDWLESAVRASAMGDLVGGRITVFDETAPPRTGAQVFETVFAFDNEAYIRTKGFSVTANLVTRRDVFEAVGPFRDGVSEDLDWCRRAVALGHRLAFSPEMVVAHPTRGTWSELERKWRRLTAEGHGVHGSGPGRSLTWAGRALLMPLSILPHAVKVFRAEGLSPADRIRGATTLARLRIRRCRWMLAQAAGRPL